MTGLWTLIKRNTKLYFKDKGMFFSSMITPVILLVLYVTFLKKVYDDSFRSALAAAGASVPEGVLNGCVGGQLASSLLAVICVTVAFCSNLLMIRDKSSGARHDLTIAPVRPGVLGWAIAWPRFYPPSSSALPGWRRAFPIWRSRAGIFRRWMWRCLRWIFCCWPHLARRFPPA